VDDSSETRPESTPRRIKFVPPHSSNLVELELRGNATVDLAIREWLVHDVLSRGSTTDRVNVAPFSHVLGFGPLSTVGTDCEKVLHLQPVRFESWDAVRESFEAYHGSGRQGIDPLALFAALAPGVHLPLVESALPKDTRRERWLYVAFDLGLPLGAQFDEAHRQCSDLQQWMHALAGVALPRPAKKELSRNILIFTLRWSRKMTVLEIAKRIFPKESQTSAQAKVKKVLRNMKSAIGRISDARNQAGTPK
jgi:hypothetical protein